MIDRRALYSLNLNFGLSRSESLDFRNVKVKRLKLSAAMCFTEVVLLSKNKSLLRIKVEPVVVPDSEKDETESSFKKSFLLFMLIFF